MKKLVFSLSFILITAFSWGQGSETFELASLPGAYSDGNFVGDNTVKWYYLHSRNDAGYEITNEGIMLRRLSSNSKVYSESVTGGIGDFTCSLLKAYTGSGNRQVELFINGVSKGTSIAWDNTNVQTFSVLGINISGDVVVEIRNISSKQVIIDDISWTAFSSGPTITTTPTSLTGFTYLEGNGPSAEQSFTVEGSNLTNDISITPQTNWEISLTTGGAFSATNPIVLAETGGTVNSTIIYTRMLTGLLQVNSPFSGDIACMSTGATTQNVAVDGTVTFSNTSDIIANTSFSYNSNIDYLAYQADPITNTSGSVGVFKFDIRDGGGNADADSFATELTDITFTLATTSHANFIRSAALFNGNAMSTNTPTIDTVAGTITFSGLSGTDFTAPDAGTASLTLRVSFNTTVTDNEQLQFTITAAVANSAGSVFATTNAGGATSSTTGDRNRLEVIADHISFTTQPTSQSRNTNLDAFVIEALDINNNKDLDAINSIALTTTGIGMSSSTPYSLVAGEVSVNDVQFSDVQAGITITATTTGLASDNVVSSTFDITDVTNGTYRTTSAGTWPTGGTATWERYTGGSWNVATPSANTTDLLIIRHNITSRTAFSASGGVGTKMQIENSGTFTASHNCTFQIMQIDLGGTLHITIPAVDILTGTGTLTVDNGGTVIIDSGTLNNDDGFWKGIENFKSGSTIEIRNWDFDSGSQEEALIDNENEVSLSTDGYYFGNIVIDANPDKIFKLVHKTGVHKLCANDLTITNQSATKSVTLTNVNASVEIGGSLLVNQNTFSFGSITSANPTHTIKGNITVAGGTLNLNQNSSGSASVTVQLEGNLSTQAGATLRSTDAGCKIVFKGDGAIQTIDLAGILGANADFEVADTAVTQIINQNIDLSNASNDFDVLSGGTLEFNYLDITGSGDFELESQGILKITSANGVNAAGATGNVQNTGTRTFSQTGYFHYVGNITPQSTGTAMTSGSTAKQIVIEKDNDADIVNLTQSTGTTFELHIKKGVFVETEEANINGSGDLKMDGNTTYKTAVTSNTVPQLSGTYTLLAGSEIDLNAAANQELKGSRAYRDLTFSNLGIKTISSAINTINGEIYITDAAILNVENKTMGGAETDLRMDGTSEYITAGIDVKPDAQGTYVLDPGTKVTFENNAGTLQRVRLYRDYYNIDIVGTNVGTNTSATPVEIQAGGTLTVKSGATFKHINTAGFNGGTTTAIDNINTPTIILENDSTVEYLGANQIITPVSPHYANVIVSGSGTTTIGHATDVVINEDLTLTSSNILIESNKSLTVSDKITNDTLIEIEDEGSLVQINETDTNDGTGDYRIHKKTKPYIEYDYTYWSSPVIGESIVDVFKTHSSVIQEATGTGSSNLDHHSLMSNIFWFDTDKFLDVSPLDDFDDDNNDWIHAPEAEIMPIGRGYIAMGAGSDWPFNTDFATKLVQSVYFESNRLHNGSFSYTLEKDAGVDAFTNQNLIGNPYASAIDLQLLRNNTANLIVGGPNDGESFINSTALFWSHDTGITAGGGPWAYNFTNADYATLNISTGIGTSAHVGTQVPTQYLASCQSIMLELNENVATSTVNVTINNAMRVKGNNDNFFKQSEKDVLWLKMTNQLGLYRQLAIVFIEGADDTVNDYDSERVQMTDQEDFYTLANTSDKRLVIQGLAPFTSDKVIPIGVEIIAEGHYTFDIDGISGLFNSQAVFIMDYKTNKLHNLTTQGGYRFEASDHELGEINNRFELRFVDGTMSVQDTSLNSIRVYPNPSQGVFSISTSKPASIQVYNINGKVVLKINVSTATQIDLTGYAKGIYIVKISDNGKQTVRKLVLK